jgi:CubicO group peptidase (beta-lactamase class C family)
MLRNLLFLFLGLSLVKGAFAQTDGEKLDALMQAAAKNDVFSGVVLVARRDSILLYKGYGWRDAERKIPNDTNSIFLIGSLSKPFTAMAVMVLCAEGKLRLEDRLSNYFPRYRYASRITIRNLLTHTSGIPNYIDPSFLLDRGDRPLSQKEFWELIGNRPLEFQPDSGYNYSNTNYLILGYVIEKVTGKTYENVIREKIFDKASMTHSGFDFAHLESPYKAIGYDDPGSPRPVRTRIGDSSAFLGCGSIYSTVGDLFRWNEALYGGSIVSQAELKQAATAYRNNYGYGWNVGIERGRPAMSHNGYSWGFHSHLKRIPADSTCVIILQNDDRQTFEDFLVSIYRILDGAPGYYIPRPVLALAADSLPRYAGHYVLGDKPAFAADIRDVDGHLMVTWTNMTPQEIYAEKPDLFHFKAYDSQLAFTRNADGWIDGFTAYASGQTFVYRRSPL